MASRHLRSLLPSALPSIDGSDEDEGSIAPLSKVTFSASTLGLLLGDSDDGDDGDDGEDGDEDDNEAQEDEAQEDNEAQRCEPMLRSESVPYRTLSNKERRAQSKVPDDDDDDDDDSLLRAAAAAAGELRAELQRPGVGTPPVAAPEEPWRLSALHLDATHELGRTFGRETVRHLAAEERRGRGTRNKSHDSALAKRELALKAAQAGGGRARLVVPRETWSSGGASLSMEVDNEAEDRAAAPPLASGAAVPPPPRHFRICHSGAYRQAQAEVDEAVEQGDPRLLQAVVRRHPSQVDALLRLGDYCATVSMHGQASQGLDRPCREPLSSAECDRCSLPLGALSAGGAARAVRRADGTRAACNRADPPPAVLAARRARAPRLCTRAQPAPLPRALPPYDCMRPPWAPAHRP